MPTVPAPGMWPVADAKNAARLKTSITGSITALGWRRPGVSARWKKTGYVRSGSGAWQACVPEGLLMQLPQRARQIRRLEQRWIAQYQLK